MNSFLSRYFFNVFFFFSSRRRHTRSLCDWSSDVCSSDLAHASRTLKALTSCDKINVAALGNVVAQLHVHVIARSRGDAAWPRPVWNAVPPRDYDKAALDKLLAALRQRLTLTPL